MDEKLQTILTELHAKLAALYGDRLAEVVLYGSQARGDATWESDIDVMVVLQGTVNPYEEIDRTNALTTALSLKYDTLISTLFVAEERFQSERSPFLLNVRREGVLV